MHRKTNTEALLERARAMCDPPTWYQLAKQTGIKQQTLSRVTTQHKTLGDINAWKLAKFLGMEPKDVMAYMAEDRAQDEPTKHFWEQQLPRLLSTVAIAIALSSSAIGGPLTVERSSTAKASTSPAIYYAQYMVRLLARTLRKLSSYTAASWPTPLAQNS